MTSGRNNPRVPYRLRKHMECAYVSSVIRTPLNDILACQFLLMKAECVVLNLFESDFRHKASASLRVHGVS